MCTDLLQGWPQFSLKLVQARKCPYHNSEATNKESEQMATVEGFDNQQIAPRDFYIQGRAQNSWRILDSQSNNYLTMANVLACI